MTDRELAPPRKFRWRRHTLYKLLECPTCGALVPTPWARQTHREWHIRLAAVLALAAEIRTIAPELVEQLMARVAGVEIPRPDSSGMHASVDNVSAGPWVDSPVAGPSPSAYGAELTPEGD